MFITNIYIQMSFEDFINSPYEFELDKIREREERQKNKEPFVFVIPDRPAKTKIRCSQPDPVEYYLNSNPLKKTKSQRARAAAVEKLLEENKKIIKYGGVEEMFEAEKYLQQPKVRQHKSATGRYMPNVINVGGSKDKNDRRSKTMKKTQKQQVPSQKQSESQEQESNQIHKSKPSQNTKVQVQARKPIKNCENIISQGQKLERIEHSSQKPTENERIVAVEKQIKQISRKKEQKMIQKQRQLKRREKDLERRQKQIQKLEKERKIKKNQQKSRNRLKEQKQSRSKFRKDIYRRISDEPGLSSLESEQSISKKDNHEEEDWRLQLRHITHYNPRDKKYLERDRDEIKESNIHRIHKEEIHSRKRGLEEEQEEFQRERTQKKRRH